MKDHREELLRAVQQLTQQQAKWDKKLWGQLTVPFTLQEGLMSLTKADLHLIRKLLRIKNASSLNKKDLAGLLTKNVPSQLEKIFLKWDQERFNLLLKMISQGGYVSATDLEAEKLEFFRSTGFVFTANHQGKAVLAIPEEIVRELEFLKDNQEVAAIIQENTEWIKLAHGMLYYFGTMEPVELLQRTENYMRQEVDFARYYDVIFQAQVYYEEFEIHPDGFAHYRVENPSHILAEQESRPTIEYYPFTKQQLLTAGEEEFVDRNKSYRELVTHLRKHYDIDKMDAEDLVEEYTYEIKNGASPHDMMDVVQRNFQFESLEEFQALTDKVMHLMNHTREWFLKGHMSAELFAKEQESLLPLSPEKDNVIDFQTRKKVGRNDPCPCGSRKKYKKCCG